MSGLMGGSWKRGRTVGQPRVPGRCAEKCHHNGLVGTQPSGHLPPRQLPTRLRHGNSTGKFHAVDMYVAQRMARLASIKHGLRGINWTQRFNYDWFQTLGVHRLTGTVGQRGAHA